MKDKKKLIVLIVMLLMPVAGIWYFIKMSLKYMKGAEIGIFFPNNFFKQFGVWSIIWIILWIVIMFIERKYKVKKIKERKNSIKILQCIVMFVMAVISFWIYVSVLTGKFNHYMMLVFLVEIIDVFMVTLVIKIFRNLIDIYFEWKENKRWGCRINDSPFLKNNKSRASQSPALGVRFKYEQKQNPTERLYLIFSVLSNQTSAGS